MCHHLILLQQVSRFHHHAECLMQSAEFYSWFDSRLHKVFYKVSNYGVMRWVSVSVPMWVPVTVSHCYVLVLHHYSMFAERMSCSFFLLRKLFDWQICYWHNVVVIMGYGHFEDIPIQLESNWLTNRFIFYTTVRIELLLNSSVSSVISYWHKIV